MSESIPDEQAEELQLRLLRSHACGVGEPYPDDVIRAAMLLRANALAKGYSGARVETVELLLAALDARCLPRVPARGSVGASGDLAPLAHLALPLVGEGEAWVEGELLAGRRGARARPGSTPVRLAAKEGLSLINGTQFMTAMASLALVRARRLARAADIACAMSLEALQGSRDELPSRDPRCASAAGPARERGEHPHAARRARRSSSRTAGATRCRTRTRCAAPRRCTARAATSSTTSAARSRSSSTPRPTTRSSSSTRSEIVSNGNFHGQPVAFALDCLAIAVAELANISERRVERLVNPALSDGLPPFLVPAEEGLNSGFMILQYVAAALVSENKVLAHPAAVDSIPTSAGQEDHVSMGNAAGLKALQVLANAERVARDRAARRRAGGRVPRAARAGPRGRAAARAFVRTLSERLREDRSLSADIERVAAAIRDGALLAAVEAAVGSARVSRCCRADARPCATRCRSRSIPTGTPRSSTACSRPCSSSSPALTGGDLARAALVAAGFFVAATAWSWWRFRSADPAARCSARRRRRRTDGDGVTAVSGDRRGAGRAAVR